jgi:hypothetical protein
MNSFKVAEEYIQLQKRFKCSTWSETMTTLNELVISPLIAIFFVCLGRMSSALTLLSAFQTWKAYIKYQSLRFEMQRMMLRTVQVGGPFIVTNDPTYMPYVYADAVMRTGQHY